MSYTNIEMKDVCFLLNLPVTGQMAINVTCPVCQGKKKMNIHMTKGFRCNKCDGLYNTHGTAVHLYGLFAHNIEPDTLRHSNEEYFRIKKEIEEKLGRGEIVEKIKTLPKIKPFKQSELAPIEQRDEAYRAFLSLLELTDDHLNALYNRGFRTIDVEMYKSIPRSRTDKICSTLVNELCVNLKGVPGFYYKNGKWDFANYSSGIIFPVMDRHKRIQGLKLRMDNSSNGAKYLWFSSKNYEGGTGAKAMNHFAGYPERTIYLTEGPIKASLIHRFLDKPALAIPGVSTLEYLEPDLKDLKKLGARKIIVCLDSDYQTNPNVQNALDKIFVMIKEIGLEAVQGVWDDNFKGIDDYLWDEFKKRKRKKLMNEEN